MSALGIIGAVVGSISSIYSAMSGQQKNRKPTDSAALRSSDPYRFAQNVGIEVNGNYEQYVKLCNRYGVTALSSDEFAQQIANNRHANRDAKMSAMYNAGYQGKDIDSVANDMVSNIFGRDRDLTQQDKLNLIEGSTRSASDSDPIGQMLDRRGANAIPDSSLAFGSDLYYQDLLNQQAERRAYAYQTELRDYDNEYNSASAQRQRYEDAGLNPNLMFGENGTAGTSTNSGAPQTMAPNIAQIKEAETQRGQLDNQKFQSVVQGVNAIFQLGINVFSELTKLKLGNEANEIGWSQQYNASYKNSIDDRNVDVNQQNADTNKQNANTAALVGDSTVRLQAAQEETERAKYANEVEENKLKMHINQTYMQTWQKQQALYNAQIFALVSSGKLSQAQAFSTHVATEMNRILYRQMQTMDRVNFGWLYNMSEKDATDFFAALDKVNKQLYDISKDTSFSAAKKEQLSKGIEKSFMNSKFGQFCQYSNLVINNTPLVRDALDIVKAMVQMRYGKSLQTSAPLRTTEFIENFDSQGERVGSQRRSYGYSPY